MILLYFSHQKKEITQALNVIEIFGSYSGLKLNRNKTEGIWIGKLKNCKDKYEDIKWTENVVKCLGVYFGHNKKVCQQMNVEKSLQKTENILNSWKKRKLSIFHGNKNSETD